MMIIMAITRLSGLQYRGKYDSTWVFLWQQIEACTAVTILSLTAFRSFFVGSRPDPNKARSWVPSTRRLLRRPKQSTSTGPGLDELVIPSATLTGFSWVPRRTGAGHHSDEDFTSDFLPLSDGTGHQPSSQVWEPFSEMKSGSRLSSRPLETLPF